ncbi:MAG: lysine biosynthesis protein [Thermofilum sp. ex4484_79]|nr:MAG: lysine biosynthesis protein [Thermofilum sp. ex4484_79]
MPEAKCPVCGTPVKIDENYTSGDIIECPNCGTELVIVKKGRKIYLEEFNKLEEEEDEENEY